MEAKQITEGNKLIAEFMGYTHPYKCDIWRGGYCLENVDLLSKYEFISLEQVLKESPEINVESRPFYDGSIQISKYGEDNFYPNVVFFSTDSEYIPVTLRYNHRIQQYHSSWDWLMPVIEKIEMSTIYDLTTSYDKREEFNGWSVHWFTFSSNDEILGFIEDKRFNTKIEASWFAVVEYIKYCNLNK